MLRELHIESYALIDRAEIEFSSGFNVLTGETGSGKSIVVDAVGLLLGGKASSDLIRSGAERARVIGVFSGVFSESASGPVSRPKGLAALLDESGIEASGHEEIIIQRDLMPGGRSRILINNQPATAGLLKTLAPYLAELHGQNEQQQLLQPSEQLSALDSFAGLQEASAALAGRFSHWRQLCARWQSSEEQKQRWRREMELWLFQQKEIEQTALAPGEDRRLEEEKRVLAHADRIQSSLAAVYDLLYDSPQAAAASLTLAERRLDEIAQFDPSLAPVAGSLAAARTYIEDAALAVRDRLSHLETSPGRLEEVEERLVQLDRLKRKYGPQVEDVLRYTGELAQKIAEAEAGDAATEALEQEVRCAAAGYRDAAAELSGQRARAAEELQRAVEKEMAALAMPGTVFQAQLTVSPEEAGWRGSGIDRVEFLLSANPGEPLRPLARIASGGEVSRIMLALETVTSARGTRGKQGEDRRTLVFDEVDAGIGGRAAETVGHKLRLLGDDRQVLCVTHLPQIASFAHHQFRVEKREQAGRTVTRIERLTSAGRKEELARMLSGTRITPAVLQHAAQLLKTNGQ